MLQRDDQFVIMKLHADDVYGKMNTFGRGRASYLERKWHLWRGGWQVAKTMVVRATLIGWDSAAIQRLSANHRHNDLILGCCSSIIGSLHLLAIFKSPFKRKTFLFQQLLSNDRYQSSPQIVPAESNKQLFYTQTEISGRPFINYRSH